MERRFLSIGTLPVALEARVGSDTPLIVGFAAVWYTPDDPGSQFTLWDYGDDDRCVERIMPTAFDQVLAAAVDCRGLFNHDPNCLLGRCGAGTMKLAKDPKGLRYTITPPDAPIAQGVIASIKRGDLTGSSFSFTVNKSGQRWVSQGGVTVREIHAVSELYDCGPVTFPAYGATTAGARTQGATDEARAAFEAWRRAGATRTAAAAQAAARARCVELGI